MNEIDSKNAPAGRKIHTDTKVFGIVAVSYWFFSLLVWGISMVNLTFSDVLFKTVDFLVGCVMISTPFFTFVVPVVLLISMIIHCVNDKRFYAYPLMIAVINVCHTVLMLHLMESWV